MPTLSDVVELSAYPLHDHALLVRCRAAFDRDGVLTSKGFLRPEAVINLVEKSAAGAQECIFHRVSAQCLLNAHRSQPAYRSYF